jgi:hypothetical protein
MTKGFLGLPLKDQAEVLRAEARRLGRRETVLEKDIWVCWTLEQLFAIADMPRMAFQRRHLSFEGLWGNPSLLRRRGRHLRL